MPPVGFGQVNTQDLDRYRQIISGATDNYLNSQMQMINLQKNTQDKQEAQKALDEFNGSYTKAITPSANGQPSVDYSALLGSHAKALSMVRPDNQYYGYVTNQLNNGISTAAKFYQKPDQSIDKFQFAKTVATSDLRKTLGREPTQDEINLGAADWVQKFDANSPKVVYYTDADGKVKIGTMGIDANGNPTVNKTGTEAKQPTAGGAGQEAKLETAQKVKDTAQSNLATVAPSINMKEVYETRKWDPNKYVDLKSNVDYDKQIATINDAVKGWLKGIDDYYNLANAQGANIPPPAGGTINGVKVSAQTAPATIAPVIQPVQESPKTPAPAADTIPNTHNNPLDIAYGDFAKGHGGSEGTKVKTPSGELSIAKFPDVATAWKAAKDLMATKYADSTVADAVKKWSGFVAGSGNGYSAEDVAPDLKDKKVKDLTPVELHKLLSKMSIREGFKGELPAPPKIVKTGTDKASGKKVVQYDDGTIAYAP